MKEKLQEELNLKHDELDDRQFNMYIKHLYKSASPSKENLADEKYFLFLQDIVDVYGLIHNRYIKTPDGKFKYFTHFAFRPCQDAEKIP